MVHELYAIMALMCAIIIGLLINRVVASGIKETTGKAFFILFSFLTVFCLIDCVWGVFASKVFGSYLILLKISTYSFHLGASISTFVWFIFNLYFIGGQYYSRKIFKIIPCVLLTCEILLVLSNIFTQKVFYFDLECNYYTNKLRFVLFIMQYISFVLMVIFSLLARIYERNKDRQIYLNVSIFYSVIPLICGLFQFFYPDMPVYSLGFMLSCLAIYVFVITIENEKLIISNKKAQTELEYHEELKRNYSIISSLAGNYDYMCLIECDTNIIHNISVSGIFKDFIKDEGIPFPPEDFDAMLRTIISKDKIQEFIANTTKDKLLGKIVSGQRVSVEVMSDYKNILGYFRFNFAIDKSNEKNVLLGIKNITSEYLMRQEIENQKNYISDLEMQHKVAVYMASIDGLTGLLNKISFIERVEVYLKEHPSKNCALLFFDMDHFKSINDVFGHNKGDLALQEMAEKLKSLFRVNEMIGRMGGDEFAVFLPNVTLEIVKGRIDKMNETLKATYSDENATIKTSVSIGCSFCQSDNVSYVAMYALADDAMYEVKNRGRDGNEIKII